MIVVEFLYLSKENCNSFLNKWLLFFAYLTSCYKFVLIKVILISY